MIKVDQNWWKDLFDEIYLLTDARSVCNDNLTGQEVDFLEKLLDLSPSATIIDLCGGQGRHALEFSRRGFNNVTVLDYSQYLVDVGKKQAEQEELRTMFVRGDARNTGVRSHSFQYVIIMASSFGYFIDENENQKILQEVKRLLLPGGTLLLDLPDKDYVIGNFKPFSSHRVDGDFQVTRERELGEDIIYSREVVVSDSSGCIRDKTYSIRLYSETKIADLLHSSGFESIHFHKNFMDRNASGDYGCMTNRMIVTARKDS